MMTGVWTERTDELLACVGAETVSSSFYAVIFTAPRRHRSRHQRAGLEAGESRWRAAVMAGSALSEAELKLAVTEVCVALLSRLPRLVLSVSCRLPAFVAAGCTARGAAPRRVRALVRTSAGPAAASDAARTPQAQRKLKGSGSRLADAQRQAADAVRTLQAFRYLRPGAGKMAGSDMLFMELKGTVQMKFAGHGYYVPLAVYLRNDHPQSPPVCIIQPTPEMMIKPNHHHVDVHGLVYLPYLHEWTQDSNVVDMLSALEEVFGREPFIFKKPVASPGGAGGLAEAGARASPADTDRKKGAGRPSDGGGAAARPPLQGGYQRTAAERAKDAEVLRQAEAYCMKLVGRDLMAEVRRRANELEDLDAVLETSFRCPISMEIMTEPVFAADGHTYEKVPARYDHPKP